MKKSTTTRRITALLAAIVLMTSMGMTAFAASNFTSGTYVTEHTTFTFRKDIVAINNGTAKYVYTPDITYTYQISPVTEAELNGTEVTDENGNSIKVYPGETGSVSLTDDSAVFTSTYTLLENGKATVSDDIAGSVDITKFQHAGIYRYVITEDDNFVTLTTQGISRDTNAYRNTRYLDIYISNNTDPAEGASPLKVSGYVLFVADNASAVIDRKTTANENIVGKTEGFVDTTVATAGGESKASLADKYYTYDLTVKVDILGSLADENNPFPITVTTEGITNRQFDYDVTVDGAVTPFSNNGAGIVNPGGRIGTPVTTDQLAKGDSVTFYGLPANTKFNVTETNDNNDTYSVTVKADGVTITDKTSVPVENTETINAFDNGTKAISAYLDYTTFTTTTENPNYKVILFENTLNDVSLTGIVLRIAPYAILLAAALLLGIFYLNSRKKKSSKNVL